MVKKTADTIIHVPHVETWGEKVVWIFWKYDMIKKDKPHSQNPFKVKHVSKQHFIWLMHSINKTALFTLHGLDLEEKWCYPKCKIIILSHRSIQDIFEYKLLVTVT